jgi:hypothetical protein
LTLSKIVGLVLECIEFVQIDHINNEIVVLTNKEEKIFCCTDVCAFHLACHVIFSNLQSMQSFGLEYIENQQIIFQSGESNVWPSNTECWGRRIHKRPFVIFHNSLINALSWAEFFIL